MAKRLFKGQVTVESDGGLSEEEGERGVETEGAVGVAVAVPVAVPVAVAVAAPTAVLVVLGESLDLPEAGELEESSDYSSEDSSGSSDAPVLVRPVFKARSRVPARETAAAVSAAPSLATALDRLQEQVSSEARASQAKAQEARLRETGGVDDTDGVEPEAEYAAWEARERERLRRDRAELEAAELAREAAYEGTKRARTDALAEYE